MVQHQYFGISGIGGVVKYNLSIPCQVEVLWLEEGDRVVDV
jgi:hypothetical protein